jgi:uncharacterized membrane protein YozB (DUF420 family)
MAQAEPSHKIPIYLSLIPVFGVVPALIAIATKKSSAKLQQTSRTALVLFLIWLVSYLSTENSTEITQQLINGSVSSLYFFTLIWLMVRTALNK